MVVLSKIYKKYLELKIKNSEKLYLFKSGKFYIFIGEDCDRINEYVVLKKVKFSNDIMKCGFPDNILDEYLRVFQNHHLDIEVIDDFTLENSNSLYDYIECIDINRTTPLEALEKLKEIKEMVKNEKRG